MLAFVYVLCFDLEQDVIISVIFLQQTSQPLGSLLTLTLFTCKAQQTYYSSRHSAACFHYSDNTSDYILLPVHGSYNSCDYLSNIAADILHSSYYLERGFVDTTTDQTYLNFTVHPEWSNAHQNP